MVGGTSERVLALAAALGDAWNASSVEADRFAQLRHRLEGLAGPRTIERQVQLWLREVGIEGAHDAVARYGDAWAEVVVFVLDEDRDSDVIARLAAALR